MAEFRDMMEKGIDVDAKSTALVVVDMTYFEAHRDYKFAASLEAIGKDTSDFFDRLENVVTPNIQSLLTAWRSAEGRVIFLRVGGQFPDYQDVPPAIRPIFQECGALRGTDAYGILDEVAPREGEVILDKSGMGGFTWTPLDGMLRSAGIDSIAVVGIVTNACVTLTALGAVDRGYSVSVIEDACASPDHEVHEQALSVMRWLDVTVRGSKELVDTVK